MQTDILTLIQNGLWKQYGGLAIPAHLTQRTLSALDVSAAVYITHEEILGKKYTREELEKDLAQLSVEDCLATTSKILTVLTNLGQLNINVQKGLTQDFFDGEMKEKIIGLLDKGPKRIVFFELQLLLLAKYAMLFAKQEPANDFGERKLSSTYTKIILGITDILSEKTEGTTVPELQRAAIRSLYFFSKPDVVQMLGRVVDVFITIPNDLRAHHQYLDIPTLFQEATGLSLEKYLVLGFALVLHPSGQQPGAFDANRWFIVREQYFSQTIVPKEEVELLMKEFVIDTQALKALYTNQDYFEYNFQGLVQHPLVTFDKHRYFPLSLGLLKDKMALQIYWTLFDYIKAKYGDEVVQRYTNFMGVCFEEYIYQLLRRIYPSSLLVASRLVREITYTVGRRTPLKTADNIIINASSLILLETKVSQLRVYSTGIVGDLESFREDVRKIIVKAFKTIQRTKEAFQGGLLRNELPIDPATIQAFYPVVVMYGTFPFFPLIWRIVEEEIQNVPAYDPELLDKLQIVQADEPEVIEAFLEASGISFEALLQKKIADPVYKHVSFHSFFSSEYQHLRPLKSKYVNEKFDHFIEDLSIKTLGTKIDMQEVRDRRANRA